MTGNEDTSPADPFPVGTAVTLAWYSPGEPHRPLGTVVEPTPDDTARPDGTGDQPRVLVHWHTGGWRRWELVAELRRDEP
ncbi:hypothetical protein [Pseudonocardia zijingensis]|uniref:DUF1918 domain-containing protein n=1 Tax=Pseudonocardia zijingensis TaxID=153376 RepID=A0ABP3ZUG9_9PSEU